MVLLNGTLLHTADLLFKSVTLWTGAWESGSGWGLGVPKLTKKHSKDVKTLCVIKLCSNGPTIARYPKRQAKRGAPTGVRLSVWTKIGQCLEDSSSHCPFPVELVTNRAGAGQGGQGSRCGGPREVPFLLKKSLGKTGGPASNQTKIQISFKISFHYRTY
jgi:hypothetical protein